ncbi:MAG: DNA polymerase III subunit beta [Bacilli bacterium]|nr:DNA polymerase III subunit beta [Bacilli bacterium]
MRLSIDREQFLKALNTTSKAIVAKSLDPLLANVKLDLNDRGLEITGTNKEVTIQCLVPYRIGDKEIIRASGLGAALINARLLTEFIRRIEGNTISLEVIDDVIAKIDDGRSSVKLNCVKAETFTDIDLEPSGTIVTVPCAAFTELVEQSAFAASVKNERALLTALNLQVKEGFLVATATDSARLARKQIPVDTEATFNCNIPARTLVDVIHLFEGADKVTLAVSESSVLFLFENTVVCSRLIAGKYLVSDSVIPVMFNYYLDVNAQEFLNAISRASLLSAERDYVVKLSMSEDCVEVSARGEQTGSSLEAIQTFQFTGERLEVSFNAAYVVDALKVLKAEDVRICFQSEKHPFVIKDPKDDSVTQLIIPMRNY